jgi:hypothetical protein
MRFDVCVVKITNMFNCVSVVGVMLPIDILKIFVCVVSEEFFLLYYVILVIILYKADDILAMVVVILV